MTYKRKITATIAGATLFTLAFLSCFNSSATFAKTKYDFPHFDSYQEGIEAAQESNRLVLLDFYFDT